MKKKLLIICFYCVIFKKDKACYKSTHAFFINDLTKYFKVSLLAGFKRKGASLKDNNEANIELDSSIKLFLSPPLEGGFFRHPVGTLMKIVRTIKAIKQCEIIHIFAPSFGPIFVGPLSKLFKKKMTVYLAADWEPTLKNFYNSGSPPFRFLFFLSEWASNAFSHTILITNNNTKLNNSKYRSKIVLTKPLVINSIFSNFFLENHTFKKNNYHFLFVGKLHPNKCIELIIEAMKEITPKLNASVSIVGDSNDHEYKNSLLKLVEKLEVTERVTWYGWVGEPEELRKIFLNHYALVLPSKTEGFPKVIYEAQSCGLPVITSNLKNYKNMLRNEENTLLFETGVLDDLVNCILKLVKNENLYLKIRENALKFARNRLSKTAAEQYRDLIY